MLMKRRCCEQHLYKPPRVLFKLLPLLRGIAIAEQQQIHLRCRIAHLLQFHQLPRRRWARRIHKLVLRIDRRPPHLVEGALAFGALFQRNINHARRTWKAQRLGKRTARMLRLVRCFPFSKHRTEAARIDQLPALPFPNLKQIVAQLALINRFGGIARPLQRLQHRAVEREPLVMGIAAVIVINPHGARGGKAEKRKQKKSKNNADGSSHARNCTSPAGGATAALGRPNRAKLSSGYEGGIHQRRYGPGVISTALSFSKVIVTGLPPFAYFSVRDPYSPEPGIPSPIAKSACNSLIPARTS